MQDPGAPTSLTAEGGCATPTAKGGCATPAAEGVCSTRAAEGGCATPSRRDGRRSLRPSEPVALGAVSFFPAFAPPRSGGEMRLWHLYTRLANLGFRVRMATATHPFVEPETIRHNELCEERRVPKTVAHHRLHQVMERVLGQGECSGVVVAMAARFHKPFVERVREIVATSRIVVFEYPFPLGPLFPYRSKDRPFLVYNAYNVESALLRETMRGMPGRLAARWLARHERILGRRADLVFACSHEDADALATRCDIDPTKIYIVPNGVEMTRIAPVDLADDESAAQARRRLGLAPETAVALFLGSQHPPNIEAARFLIEKVAPRLPETAFLVAGSVCEGLLLQGAEARTPSTVRNVRLHGKFEEEEKRVLMRAATVAVNPVFSGSGTNLKMLEFFAAGLPVVSTQRGARGLAARDGQQLVLASAENFAETLEDLLADREKRITIGRASRRLAGERYDWDHIAEAEAEILHHKTHRRVLVLNDYPMTPVSTGGTVRLFNHYREVAREANVTVLTQTQDAAYRRQAPAPGLEEINIPETRLNRLGRKALSALVGVATDDVVAYLTVGWNRAMRRAFERESRFARAVVLSHPFMVPLLRRKYEGADPVRAAVIYESHNVEAHLKEQLYGDGFWGRWGAARARACEREAVGRARALASCSEENNERFRRLYPEETRRLEDVLVVPNGVNCAAHQDLSAQERRALKRQAGLSDNPIAIFVGSGHPPNVEAARHIVETLAPDHPDVLFMILGGACWPLKSLLTRPARPRPGNVLFFFEQSETTKNRLLDMADIALNPLTKGSGVSLKALDYLAAGTAVVTTEIGMRGVKAENGVHAVICPLEQFSREIARLAGNPGVCHQMGERGQRLAREVYDWSVTTQPFIDALVRFLAP
jgi:glycosyltransferase involved in cell wall biosynthesis